MLAVCLVDTVESLWHDVKVGFAFGKVHLVVAPRSDDTVTRKEDLLVKSALFDFFNQHQQPESSTTVDITTGYTIVLPVDFTMWTTTEQPCAL